MWRDEVWGLEMGTHIVDNLAVYATCISNDFLDKYLATANGDYIKVYLLMLRHKGEQFTVTDAADALNLTDGDIERAVRYWEKQGVFKAGADALVRDAVQTETAAEAEEEAEGFLQEAQPMEEAEADEEKKSAASEPPMTGTVEEVMEDEEFAGILFVAKHVLPTLPSVRQVEVLQYMYRELHMQSDVIEYLLEYCASIKKTTSKYMQAVAINWHEQGIVTLAQARGLVKSFEEKKTKKKSGSSRSNRFLNIDKSTIDYDSIAQKRVLNRMKNGTHECTV